MAFASIPECLFGSSPLAFAVESRSRRGSPGPAVHGGVYCVDDFFRGGITSATAPRSSPSIAPRSTRNATGCSIASRRPGTARSARSFHAGLRPLAAARRSPRARLQGHRRRGHRTRRNPRPVRRPPPARRLGAALHSHRYRADPRATGKPPAARHARRHGHRGSARRHRQAHQAAGAHRRTRKTARRWNRRRRDPQADRRALPRMSHRWTSSPRVGLGERACPSELARTADARAGLLGSRICDPLGARA